jgi:hypothetical protein
LHPWQKSTTIFSSLLIIYNFRYIIYMNKALVGVIALLVILGGVALWMKPGSGVTVNLNDPNANPGLTATVIDAATTTAGLPVNNATGTPATTTPSAK